MASVTSGKAELVLGEHGLLQLTWARHSIVRNVTPKQPRTWSTGSAQILNAHCWSTWPHVRGQPRSPRVFTRTCQASRVALLGASPVDKVVANFVLAINKTGRPKRFFTSRAEAMTWLTTGTMT